MTSATNSLKKTALWAEHKALNAKLVPFAGYDMPVQYSSVLEEHKCVREKVGVFDVSHMGLCHVHGREAQAFINSVFTKDFQNVPAGQAAYTLLCRENGNCVDDLIVYCKNPEDYYIVFNASNKEKDIAYIREHSPRFDVKIEGPLDHYSILAIQGPKSEELMKSLGFDKAWPAPFQFMSTQLMNIPVMLAFTGYTGEKGCEIFIENIYVEKFWKELLDKGQSFGLAPIGLAARDTLRTEMGYSLYGHELTEDINPIEAGLSWAVSFNKKNFLGKAALLEARQSKKRKLVCLKNNKAQAPRSEMKVFDSTQKQVGHITSGTYAPSLGHAIGMALVDFDSKGPYEVEIRNQKVLFEECQRPFYKKEKT